MHPLNKNGKFTKPILPETNLITNKSVSTSHASIGLATACHVSTSQAPANQTQPITTSTVTTSLSSSMPTPRLKMQQTSPIKLSPVLQPLSSVGQTFPLVKKLTPSLNLTGALTSNKTIVAMKTVPSKMLTSVTSGGLLNATSSTVAAAAKKTLIAKTSASPGKLLPASRGPSPSLSAPGTSPRSQKPPAIITVSGSKVLTRVTPVTLIVTPSIGTATTGSAAPRLLMSATSSPRPQPHQINAATPRSMPAKLGKQIIVGGNVKPPSVVRLTSHTNSVATASSRSPTAVGRGTTSSIPMVIMGPGSTNMPPPSRIPPGRQITANPSTVRLKSTGELVSQRPAPPSTGPRGGQEGPIRATAPMWRCSRIMHTQRDLHPTILSSLEGIVDQMVWFRENWYEEVYRQLRQVGGCCDGTRL